MTEMELYLKTNPVFTTAESCLTLISMTGDPDAIKMADYLGITMNSHKDDLPEAVREKIFKMLPAIIANIESRFESHNNFINECGYKNIVDLPCGFQPRGPRYVRKGKTYYGLDLPAVIGRVSEAAHSVTEEEYKSNLHYCAVDATNYDSLHDALKDVDGEMIITTEGLLMYFNDFEVKTVCSNIAKLLSEFGGCWVTFDPFSQKHSDAWNIAILGVEGMKSSANLSGAAGSMADFNTNASKLYAPDKSEALAMLDEAGLTVESVPLSQYFGDFRILKKLPEGTIDRVKENMDGVDLWIMRAKENESWKHSESIGAMKVDCKNVGGVMELELTGRLDSLNAPQLLETYEKLAEEKPVEKVCVHMKDLEYISSAGLRTLLLIYKKMDGSFTVNDCSDTVQNILDMTGFSDIFQ